MSTVKSKKLQVGTDASASNNFTIYQPATPDGTLRIGVGNADSPTEVGRFTSAGYKPSDPIAFKAYQSTDQSINSGVFTKLTIDTVDFDTCSGYDTSNYRWTPTVAGYYQINGKFQIKAGAQMLSVLRKNGSDEEWGMYTTGSISSTVSTVVYMNGSTDYVELYGYNVGSQTTQNPRCILNGILISQA